jgi:tRNA modification GTPase
MGDRPGDPIPPSDESAAVDTICAVATAPGPAGIGIVRISGPRVPEIAEQILDTTPKPRQASYARFLDQRGDAIDTGLALYFRAPASFTGEHVLELQGHGGPVVLQMLMQRLMSLGARSARPGEFSERAFLNGRMDLAQAEAIADLISSGTEAAVRAAQHSMEGLFSQQVEALQQRLTALRVFVEAAIDFPEEEIDFLAQSDVTERVKAVEDDLLDLLGQARQGRLLHDGIVLAIAGRPNAGKSSLLNALSGRDSAIVTDIPGTTRDVLREQIELDGIPVHLADTAGIRETRDRIEAEGVRRARQALDSADVVLLVIDATGDLEEQQGLIREAPGHAQVIKVFNKSDLLPGEGGQNTDRSVWISAKTGAGIQRLKQAMRAATGAADQSDGAFSARQRHIDALGRVALHLQQGRNQQRRSGAGELLAEELRLAQQALGEITGEMLPDDLLGEIFSSFCIGK